jgi:hypothetical protein
MFFSVPGFVDGVGLSDALLILSFLCSFRNFCLGVQNSGKSKFGDILAEIFTVSTM